MTRIQRERFASEEDYQAQKNVFVLDKEKLDKALRYISSWGCSLVQR